MTDEPPPPPDRHVCPRCGNGAAESYCAHCGLHLAELDELPTRASWEADQAPPAPTPVSTGPTAPDRTPRVVAIVAIVVFCGLVAVAAIASSGNDSTHRESSYAGTAEPSETYTPQPAPEERCVDLWNDGEESSSIFTNASSDVYVFVGFSAEFPDRCLIAVARLDLGLGLAYGFRELRSGSEPFQRIFVGNVEQLPESSKQWNATMDSAGDLHLES